MPNVMITSKVTTIVFSAHYESNCTWSTYKLHDIGPMFIDKHVHIIKVYGVCFNTCYKHILTLIIELNTWCVHHVTH